MEPNAELISSVSQLGVATVYLIMVWKVWTELQATQKARVEDLKQINSVLLTEIQTRLTNLERRMRGDAPGGERGESEARGGD